MNIRISKEENKSIVYISGSVDIPGAESLKKSLAQLIEEGATEVVIDFKDVTFIGSSGIGKLLLFYKNFTSKGGKVEVINLNEEIRTLFKAIKLDKLFNI